MKEKPHENKDEITKNKVKNDEDCIISYDIGIYNKDEDTKSDLSEFDLILKKIIGYKNQR